MNIRVCVISLLCSVIWLSAKAQVDKQVEVTKAYIPQIESSQKLKLEPDMSDTVRLRPEIDYTITPRTISTVLSTRQYQPATVTYWEFNRPERGYLKAAIGAPIASDLDFYISNTNPNTNYVIGYVNHDGKYAKIDDVSALNTQNKIGGVAGLYLGDRILEGEASYSADYWSRYATNAPLIEHPLYQRVSLSGRYGDEFIDFERWNFGIDLGANYLFNNSDNEDLSLEFAGKFGGRLGGGRLIMDVGYTYINGSSKYLNNSILISPTYTFNSGKFLSSIGAKYIYDDISSEVTTSRKNYVIPNLALKYLISAQIEPFVEIDGELYRNNYASLTDINPYIREGAFVDRSSVDYSFRGGISGLLAKKKLLYNMHVDYTITQNALYWALVEDEYETGKFDNYYDVTRSKLQAFSVNASLKYQPIGGLDIDLKAKAVNYTGSDDVALSVARPSAEAYLGVEHTTKVVRYGVSGNLEGVKYTTLVVNGVNTSVQTPVTVNVKAFVEYSTKSNIVLFLEGENLANANLYRWMGYREYGIGALAGVRMQF